jgi:nucleotide-binding universal stress UspA family protein
MKKILVPTDFSKLSANALDYAVQLAKKTEAEVLLFHVYTIPVFTEDPTLISTEQYLEEDALDNLEKLKESIEKSNPELQISYAAKAGFPVEQITDYATKQHVDMIVVGSQGVGYIQERVLGSTASSLIRKVRIPLMIIDKQVRFKEPKKIVLGVDFAETDDQMVLAPLKKIAATYQSHICILNIFTEANVIPTFGEIAESFNLEKALKHTHHTFFEVEHPDVVLGINNFVKKHNIDLVAIISRTHSLIGRVFREPLTKAMTFHSLVPLLILHE